MGSGVRQIWIKILIFTLARYRILSKLLNISEPEVNPR